MEERDPETNPPEPGPMDQFSAHLDRGWDLVHRGDLEGAQLSAEKSLELDNQSPEAHNLLGYVRAARGDAEDALEHYREAIALDDSFVEAMLNAAEVLIHPIHDFDAAMQLVDEALDFAEGNDEMADALLLKFDAHMHQGDRDAARRVVSSLPRGDFESARLDFLVGRAHHETGAPGDARPLLERAVSRDPDNADAHYYLALALEALGDTPGATLGFLRVRDLDLMLAPVPWALSPAQFERRVQAAVRRLAEPLSAVLDGALIVVCDAPGAEVVADGVDPRAGLMLDALGPKDADPSVGRVFVYQRNMERIADGLLKLEDELTAVLEQELRAAYPELAPGPEQKTVA